MIKKTSNILLNSIISSKSKAVFIIASAHYNKPGLITEISNMYSKVFWFDALSDDLFCFKESLVETIISNDDLRFKLHQLGYKKNDPLIDKTIMVSIFDYLSQIKGEKLIVFENMHLIKCNNIYKKLIYFIKHLPDNTKAIISSDKFFEFQPNYFEPNYPIMVGDRELVKCKDIFSFDEYLDGVSGKDLAFLIYSARLPVVDKEIIHQIYPEGENILEMLSRKGVYINSRDVVHYKYNDYFKEHLLSLESQYNYLIKEFEFYNIEKMYLSHLEKFKKFRLAVGGYIIQNDMKSLNNCIKNIIKQKINLEEIVKDIQTPLFDDYRLNSDYIFCTLLNAYKLLESNKIEASYEVIVAIVNNAKLLKLPFDIYIAFSYLYLIILLKNDDKESILLELDYLKKAYKCNKFQINILAVLTGIDKLIFEFRLSELELLVSATNISNEIWYIYFVEKIAIRFLKLGDYKKSTGLAKLLKTYIIYYKVPVKIISLFYFLGEIDYFKHLIDDSLGFAIKNEVFYQRDILYSLKAMLEEYHSNIKYANSFYDLAYETIEKIDSLNKFYIISQRIVHKARIGQLDYARELIDVMLSYSTEIEPRGTMLMTATKALISFLDQDYYCALNESNAYLKSSKSSLIISIQCMAIVANVMHINNQNKQFEELAFSTLTLAANSGVVMVIVDGADDIFKLIINYAKKKRLLINFIEKIDNLLSLRKARNTLKQDINISFFGVPSVFLDNQEIKWRTSNAKNLFLLYVLHINTGIAREQIISFFWPKMVKERAMQNLRTTNNYIRNILKKHKIEFKIIFANNKYSLRLKNFSHDYNYYIQLFERFQRTNSLARKIEYLDKLIEMQSKEFCQGVNITSIAEKRKNIKQNLIIGILQTINMLISSRKAIDSKKYLMYLNKIDKSNSYKNLENIIEKRISEGF